ncbi:MAG: alkaline phosphatase family protein [Isosphaeraceae bacterium]
MPAPASRVLFLGLDGGTMNVLTPLFGRGWLPNLATLWRRSAHGTLRSTTPMVTPVAWTSFLTGCTPQVHGIHDFHDLDPQRRAIRSVHAGRIRVPTLWQVFDNLGLEVVSLGLPMTYPAPPIRGLIVAGAEAPDLTRAFAQCPDFGAEVQATIPNYTQKLVWKDRPSRLDDLKRLSSQTQGIFQAQAEAAELADRRVDWSALMVHFHNLDGLQHRLWPYLEVDETGLRDPAWNHEVEACLRALDDAAGRLLELASKRDAAVIVASDHGFGPCKAIVNVNGLLQKAGLQRRLAYGTRFRYRASRLADRFRRWQSRRTSNNLVRQRSRSLEGQVGCDWSRTLAFAPYGGLCGSIYLNLDLVPTESAADRIRREVIDVCKDAKDPETNALLFADTFAMADRYGFDPVLEGLPDVLAHSADGYQAQAKWGPFCRRLLKPDWSLPATHAMDGVVAIDAPDIHPGPTLHAELHDLAPTALAVLGLPIPGMMQGRVLQEAFESPLPVPNDNGPPVDLPVPLVAGLD